MSYLTVTQPSAPTEMDRRHSLVIGLFIDYRCLAASMESSLTGLQIIPSFNPAYPPKIMLSRLWKAMSMSSRRRRA